MSIRSGRGSISRRNAKNFTDATAQRRLEEAVRPIQDQQRHALGVDSHAILYYSKSTTAQACTCKEVQRAEQGVEEASDIGLARINPESVVSKELAIDWRRPLFGIRGENADFQEDSATLEDDDLILDDEDTGLDTESVDPSPALFTTDAECGICYKNGTIPGYTLFGQQRIVLTTREVEDLYGYTISRHLAPHRFDVMDRRECYATFTLVVPRYFKGVRISVRDNLRIVQTPVYYNSQPMSKFDLMQNAGRTIALTIRQEAFTHVVVEFDIGSSAIHANIAQISKVTDWTLFDTIGNLNVVLPTTIPEVQTGDVLIVPDRGLSLKITDVPYLRTSGGFALDWQATTRVLQPQEPLKHIAKGNKLL